MGKPESHRYPRQFEAANEAAGRNCVAILADTPWLHHLGEYLNTLLEKPGSDKAIIVRMRRLADRIAAAIAPHTVCRKSCAHCCNIAVAMSESEARVIGSDIGRVPMRIEGVVADNEAERTRYTLSHFSEPCPFLANGACSIYASRPLSCRLHFNIGDSPFFCSTDIAPEDSIVPNLDLTIFWIGLAVVTDGAVHGDIRDFFGRKP